MKKIVKPVECELYQVYAIGGEKMIHIFAYTYKSDVDWRMVEGTGMIMPLREFMAGYAERGQEYVDELWEMTKQVEWEESADSLVKAVNSYFYGRAADKRLQYGDVTARTREGCYIHFNAKK